MDDAMDVERLKILVEQENRMLTLLESSCKELGSTVDELQSRYDVVEDESNEWKTRYEIQAEINEQLRRQIPLLTDKLEEARGGKKTGRSNIWNIPTDGLITNYTLTMLERQKMHLKSQETELLSRVDQEAKAYYKADEQRRSQRLELHAIAPQNYDVRRHPKGTAPNTSRRYGFGHRVQPEPLGNRNIPPNQRILNARHGPIKKTAAVKQLPALHNDRNSTGTGSQGSFQNPLQPSPQHPIQTPPQQPVQTPPQYPVQTPPQHPAQSPADRPAQQRRSKGDIQPGPSQGQSREATEPDPAANPPPIQPDNPVVNGESGQ